MSAHIPWTCVAIAIEIVGSNSARDIEVFHRHMGTLQYKPALSAFLPRYGLLSFIVLLSVTQ